jgi:hypothetical protein
MDAKVDMARLGRQADSEATVLLKGSTLEQAIERLRAVLQAGDLIFLERRGWLYRQVAKATGSWVSHVGLCLQDEHGEWMVYEASTFLARRVPLTRFIHQNRATRFAVRRLKSRLSVAALQRLGAAAEHCVGRLNTGNFDLDARQLFCTKLVYQVFQEALGVGLGQVITLRDLQPQLPASTLRFWRLWYLGAIPWQRRTITPHSQYTDPGLQTVFESF